MILAIILSSVALAVAISCFVMIILKKDKKEDFDQVINNMLRNDRNLDNKITRTQREYEKIYNTLFKTTNSLNDKIRKLEDDIRMGMYNDVDEWLDENEKYLKNK